MAYYRKENHINTSADYDKITFFLIGTLFPLSVLSRLEHLRPNHSSGTLLIKNIKTTGPSRTRFCLPASFKLKQ